VEFHVGGVVFLPSSPPLPPPPAAPWGLRLRVGQECEEDAPYADGSEAAREPNHLQGGSALEDCCMEVQRNGDEVSVTVSLVS
jgi:hypothetical protein